MINNVYMVMSRIVFLLNTGGVEIDSYLAKTVSRMKLSRSVLAGGLALLFLASGALAEVNIELDGSGASNLAQITVDGVAHTNFVGMDMTAFNFVAADRLYQAVTNGSAVATGAAASALMEDFSLITGYSGLGTLSYDFHQGIVNRDGPEIFIFELGYAAGEGTVLNVTLNGQTNDIAGGSNPFTVFADVTDDMFRTKGVVNVTSVVGLESIPSSAFESYGHKSTDISYVAIDLSDYGVAPGKSVSSITLSGDYKWDISAVIALPPPVDIQLDGSGAGNLAQITVDGVAHTEFVDVDMTAFDFVAADRLYQAVPNGSAAATGEAATALMEDTNMITGYSGLGTLSYDFLQRVENIDGPEIFIIEFGYDADEATLLNVTLNGQTHDIAGGSNPFAVFANINRDSFRTPGTVHVKDIYWLERMDFESFSQNLNIDLCYAAVDLSDYGVPLGERVSNITISGNYEWDISAVVGLKTDPHGTLLLVQ